MEPVTPRELEATIKALDASWQARFEVLDGKLDARVDRLFEIVKDSKETANKAIEAAAVEGANTRAVSRSEAATTRWAIVGAVLALGGLMVAIAALEPAFFESGRNVGGSIADVNASVKALDKRLDEASKRVDPPSAINPSQPAPAPKKQ